MLRLPAASRLIDWDTFCHWALVDKGEKNGSGVMLLFVVRTLAPNRMR